MPTSNDKPHEQSRQKPTDEDMSLMVDSWAPQALVCSPLINSYMEITFTLCSKTLFTHFCLPNLGRKALGSLSINSVSSIQGKILCSWDLGCSSATIKALSLLIPKVHRKSLTLTLLSSWWSFLHWLNLQRVFGRHPTNALYEFLVFLFLKYPIGALVDNQLTNDFCASSLSMQR